MHEMFEDAVHVFMAFPFLEATRIAFQSQRDFVLSVLPSHAATRPQPLGPEESAALGSEIETADAKVVSGVGAELSSEDEQQAKERWEQEAVAQSGGAEPIERSDTSTSSLATEEDDALATPSTDRGGPREVEESLLGLKVGMRRGSEGLVRNETDSVPTSDPTIQPDTLRTPRSRSNLLPTIKEPAIDSTTPSSSASSSRDPSPAVRPPRLTRAVTAFVSSTTSSLATRLRSPSISHSVTSSPISPSTTLPFLTSPRRKLPNGLNVHVQELLPKAPKTRGRSASHPEVCDLVRAFQAMETTKEGEVTGGELEKSSSGGGLGSPASPYRVKLYTPGKGGGLGIRRRDEAEVEDRLGGGV